MASDGGKSLKISIRELKKLSHEIQDVLGDV